MLQTPKHITAIIESHLDQMTRLPTLSHKKM